jgi:hypothetical protein
MFGLREAEIEGILLYPESAVILADHPEMAWFQAKVTNQRNSVRSYAVAVLGSVRVGRSR